MKSYALFQEYIWLVNTIHKAGKITLDEINRRWLDTEMSEGVGEGSIFSPQASSEVRRLLKKTRQGMRQKKNCVRNMV